MTADPAGLTVEAGGGSRGGAGVAPDDIDDDPAVQAHIAWLRLRGLSDRTWELRRTALRRLIAHAARPLLDLGPAELDAWQHHLTGLAPQSRRAYVVQIAGFYRWATDEALVAVDPSLVLVRPKVGRGLPRPIGEHELAAATTAAAEPVRCWLTLAAYAGLRAGELARLDRGNVLDRARHPALLVHGKGSKERWVPLNRTSLAALRAHGLPRRGPVFRDEHGDPFGPRQVSQRCNRHLHRLGIEDTIHQCRHRFATETLAAGADLRVVQELLGHASPATTAIYTQVAPARAIEAVAALDGLVVGQPTLRLVD